MARPRQEFGSPAFLDRFWSKVDVGEWDECWPWTARVSDRGYGEFYAPRGSSRLRRCHQVAYELLVGPIPDGLELDHVQAWGCVRRDCCNPLHLEPVTHAENLRRGSGPIAVAAAKTHCDHGHEFTPENTRIYRGKRCCRTCRPRYDRAFRARRADRG